MSENFMAQLGMSLIERGYPILPLQPQSKKPGRYRLGGVAGLPQVEPTLRTRYHRE